MLCFSGSGDRREREARFKGCNKLAFICFSQRATKPNKHLPCPSNALPVTRTLWGCCDEVNQNHASWEIYCKIYLEYFVVCFNIASTFSQPARVSWLRAKQKLPKGEKPGTVFPLHSLRVRQKHQWCTFTR